MMALTRRKCCCAQPDCTTGTAGWIRKFPLYDEAAAYSIGDKVRYDGDVYQATTASSTPAGPWNASDWSITGDDPDAIKHWTVIEGSITWDGDAIILAANTTIELDPFASINGIGATTPIAIDLPEVVTDRLRIFRGRKWSTDQLYNYMQYSTPTETIWARDGQTETRENEYLGPYIEIRNDGYYQSYIEFGEVTYGVCEEQSYGIAATRQVLPVTSYPHRITEITQVPDASVIEHIRPFQRATVARYRTSASSQTTAHAHGPVAYKAPGVDGPRTLKPFQPAGFANPITDSIQVNSGPLRIRTFAESQKISAVRGETIYDCNIQRAWGAGFAEASPLGYDLDMTIDLTVAHLSSPNMINFTQNIQTEYEYTLSRAQFSHNTLSEPIVTGANVALYRVTHANGLPNGSSGWCSFWHDAVDDESYIELVVFGVAASAGSPPVTEYWAVRFTKNVSGLFSTSSQSHSMDVEAITVGESGWTNYADIPNCSGTVSW